jgi:hypothetical protein
LSCFSSQSFLNFVFSFESRIHGDDLPPFDGPGSILGHAIFPESGEAHFDEEEAWTINETNGK